MKSIISIILLSVTLFTARAENPTFVNKMKSTIAALDSCKTVLDFVNTANTFDRISKMAPDEWLPLYYNAYINVILMYIDTAATSDDKDKYLEIAGKSVDKLLELNPDESEVQSIYAFYLISKIGTNPMVYGILYMGRYNKAIEKSLELEPENPRARYMAISAKVGKAQFFGNDVSEFCPEITALNDTWYDYTPKSDIHPTWGRYSMDDLMKNCQ